MLQVGGCRFALTIKKLKKIQNISFIIKNMRLKLTLNCPLNSTLAYEHHHALRAVIYKVLQRADPVFSHWLHEQGYDMQGHKKFKLFTFGLLTGKPFRRDDVRKCLVFPSGQVEWVVSFCVDTQVEKFVEGLFKNQRLEVVAADTKVVFQVQSVQILNKPHFTETMIFRSQTGICLTEKTEQDRYPQFRSPNDAVFKQLFFTNLRDKVRAVLNQNEIEASLSVGTPMEQFLDLKILSEPKKWSAIVPAETPGGKDIRTIGYRFDFEIKAPAEWLRIGYFAGFGGKASGGFGFGEVLK
jgi:CRISPR-associated endoribonuclease Cas6